MTCSRSQIVKVTFPEAIEGKTEHYFGSIAAIYEKFTPFQIGCKKEYLWKSKIEPGKPKQTKKCIVSKEELIRKVQESPATWRKI